MLMERFEGEGRVAVNTRISSLKVLNTNALKDVKSIRGWRELRGRAGGSEILSSLLDSEVASLGGS